MNYLKGQDVLPTHLLTEIQKYVNGGLVYIPKDGNRAQWGSKNGTKRLLTQRNETIRVQYNDGLNIKELSDTYYLSEETIKKIIYCKK